MSDYDAFVSYSHASDGRLAPAIREGLERLARPWNRRRALRIFHDASGLAITPALWDTIRAALDGSEFFILMGSPEAAESHWVNQEVARFLETHPPEQLLLVVTGGECVWDSSAGRLDWRASTAVPPAFKEAIDREPKYLDLRWARHDVHLDLGNARFRSAIGDLAAPIHGMPRDELDARDLREFRKARRLRRTAVVALALLAVTASGAGLAAVRNANEARSQTVIAELNADEARNQTAVAESAVADLEAANGTLEELDAQIVVAEQELGTAVSERDAAKAENTSRSLAAEAIAQINDSNPIGAYQLALAAYRSSPTMESVDSLYAAATESLPIGILEHEGTFLLATALHPKSSYVAVATNDARVTLWQLPGLEASLLFKADEAPVALAFSPDGSQLAVASGAAVFVVSVPDGRVLLTLDAHGEDVVTVLFAPDGSTVFTASADAVVRVWDAISGEMKGSIKGTGGLLLAADVSSTGTLIALGYEGGAVGLWDFEAASLAHRIGGHDGDVSSVDFDSIGQLLATASADDTVILWNTRTGDLVQRLTTQTDTVLAVQFSPEDRHVAFGGFGSVVSVVDVRFGIPIETYHLGSEIVWTIDYAPGRPWLMAGMIDGSLMVWGIGDVGSANLTRHGAAVSSADFGLGVVATGGEDGRAVVWDIATGSPRMAFDGHAEAITDIRLSPDDSLLVTASSDGSARLWDVVTGDQRYLLIDDDEIILSARFSPDGTKIATASSADRIDVWSVEDGVLLASLAHSPLGTNISLSMAFNPVGDQLLTYGSNGPLRLWDLGTERLLWESDSDGAPVLAASFSPDGSRIVAGESSLSCEYCEVSATIHDTASGEIQATLNGHTGFITTIAFSPNGDSLLTAGSDSEVRIWATGSGTLLATLNQPEGIELAYGIGSAEFSPDGLQVIAGSEEGRLIVWDLDISEVTHSFLAHDGGINAVTLVPDLQHAVSVSNEGEIGYWMLDLAELIRTMENDLTQIGWSVPS